MFALIFRYPLGGLSTGRLPLLQLRAGPSPGLNEKTRRSIGYYGVFSLLFVGVLIFSGISRALIQSYRFHRRECK